jgi:hypothetical protein
MRTLHQGELYSLDRRAGLDVQVAKCISKFKTKHRKEPSDIRWNPGAYKDDKATVQIAVDKSVPPLHMWLELPYDEAKD